MQTEAIKHGQAPAQPPEPSDHPGAWTCTLCGFKGFWHGGPHCGPGSDFAGADSTGPLTRPAKAGALNSAPAPVKLDPDVLRACKATLGCLDFEHQRLNRHWQDTDHTRRLRRKVAAIAETLEAFIAAMERP